LRALNRLSQKKLDHRVIDDVQCYETVRELRWPEIRKCPFCYSISTIKKGCDDRESAKNHFCRTSPTPQSVDIVPIFHGVEFV